MIPSLTRSLTGTKLESVYGDVGQDGLFILWFNVMTELLFPSLTGTKTDCLFGVVGYIFCALIKVLWLTRNGRLVTISLELRLSQFLMIVSDN